MLCHKYPGNGGCQYVIDVIRGCKPNDPDETLHVFDLQIVTLYQQNVQFGRIISVAKSTAGKAFKH